MTRLPMPLFACALSLALGACNVERATPVDPTASANRSAGQAAPDRRAADPSAPVPPVAGAGPDDAVRDARFDGYGALRFGMSAADARRSWAGDLTRHGADGEPCYHLSPASARTPAEFALMIEDDRFVRYSTESERYIAPGGGRVGMTSARIQALYPGSIERLPHKYTDGQYLRIKDPADATRAVLFETDAKGLVTEWRAGVAPQVDYVEGCS